MAKSSFKKNDLVKVSSFSKRRFGEIGTVIGGGDGYTTIEFSGGLWDSIADGYISLVVSSDKKLTSLDNAIALMKKRTIVVLVDGVDTHFIKVSRKDVIELINNPHTYRVTVQHANGNIKGIYDKGSLHAARILLQGKKDYVWVICGGGIE